MNSKLAPIIKLHAFAKLIGAIAAFFLNVPGVQGEGRPAKVGCLKLSLRIIRPILKRQKNKRKQF